MTTWPSEAQRSELKALGRGLGTGHPPQPHPAWRPWGKGRTTSGPPGHPSQQTSLGAWGRAWLWKDGHLGALRCCCRWPRAGSPHRASSPCARLPQLLGHPHWPQGLCAAWHSCPFLHLESWASRSPIFPLSLQLHSDPYPTQRHHGSHSSRWPASKLTRGQGPIWRGVSLFQTSPRPSGLRLGIGGCGGLLEGQGHGEGGVCVCV